MSADADIDGWIAAYVEGTLNEEDRSSLTAAISGNSQREQEFIAQVRLHLGLSSLLRQDAAEPVLRRAALICGAFEPERKRKLLDSARALKPASVRRARFPVERLAAAAVMLIAVLGAALVVQRLSATAQPPVAVIPPVQPHPISPIEPPRVLGDIANVAGSATIERAAEIQSPVGGHFQSDDQLVTGSAGGMQLSYPGEGTRITLGQETRLAVLPAAGKSFRLISGSVGVEAAPQPAGLPLRISTPRADLTVVGTAFTASCNPLMTWLDVEHGTVRLGSPHDQLALQVGAGQRALATTSIQVIARDHGCGLLASYHDGSSFEHLSLVRIDPTVDFDWHDQAPDQRVEREHFSVRWSGDIEPLFSETYRFKVASDDGARLWIDGRLVIDNWHIQSVDYARPATGTIVLTAHRKVRIRLDYFEFEHLAAVRLGWESRSQMSQVVPAECLYPAPP
jgi:ferric-dicitrate binding protein FerR (iron transport regulator)